MSTEQHTPETDAFIRSRHDREIAWTDEEKGFARTLELQRNSFIRQLATCEKERDKACAEATEAKEQVKTLLPLAYETRPGMALGPVTWQDCYKQALKSYYDTQEERDALRAEVTRLTKERDEFQAELQKVCDHDWKHIDDSFDHEFGTEQQHSCLCEKCGATKPYEPETFGDEAI